MTPLLAAILKGAARPASPLPGEYGAQFILRLHEEAQRNLKAENARRFLLVRSCVHCAINAANRQEHDEAARWIRLAGHLTTLQTGDAHPVSLSCLKAAEAYCQLKNGNTKTSLYCLEIADQADAKLSPEHYPALQAQRLHYRHLEARVLLEEDRTEDAILCLSSGLKKAAALAAQGYRHIDLLSYACSRLAGELAIAARSNIAIARYLALTESLGQENTEGSVAEYLLFRQALAAREQTCQTGPLIAFLELGRMKTVCWYAAVVEAAILLTADERADIAITASQWRDMPAVLRSRLIALLV